MHNVLQQPFHHCFYAAVKDIHLVKMLNKSQWFLIHTPTGVT